ncbi:hypothetical protein AB4124_06115 [Paenibacillus sp. 2KB_20]|uniref:hypothetical protein n=1 Tax=Paenibacillus sp. 2KB_20 TaxID=3232977 RepID=UPI003F9DF7E5
MTGYVVLYTTTVGLESFILTGSCHANIKPAEIWNQQIIVPREGIKPFVLDEDDQLVGHIKVDVRSL